MPIRRLTRLSARLLLAALLLVAQHGAWLHELGHAAAADTQHAAAAHAPQRDSDIPHAPMDLCRLCLAFAPIDSAATPPVPPLPLAAELCSHSAVLAPYSNPHCEGPPRHSRGPPPAA
jgi:hypothetical protein